MQGLPGLAPSCAEGWGRRCRLSERPPGNLDRELLLRAAASASSPQSSRHPASPQPPRRRPPPRGFSAVGPPRSSPPPSFCSGLCRQHPARGERSSTEPPAAAYPRPPHGWGYRGGHRGGTAAPPAPRVSHRRPCPPAAPSCALFKAVERPPSGVGGVRSEAGAGSAWRPRRRGDGRKREKKKKKRKEKEKPTQENAATL